MAISQFPSKGGIPSGNTASRPGSPVVGDTFYNGQLGQLEIYNGTAWIAVSAPPLVPTIATPTNASGSDAYSSTAGKLSVVFTRNASGGEPIQYNAYTTSGGFSASSSTSTVTLTGLTPGTAYTVYGNVSNNFGTSTNTANAAAATPSTLPEAPTIGTATGGNASATLTFTAGNSGGSSITNYKYSIDGTTYTAFSPAQTTSPLTISGLTNDTAYTFRLKAVNANGDSPASGQSNSVTPLATITVDMLVIAGGGGGGGGGFSNGDGGGGGAGGLLNHTNQTLTYNTTYTVTVGTGGNGGTGLGGNGSNGTNSNVTGGSLSLTAAVGGGGGGSFNATDAGDGGSGGGGANHTSPATQNDGGLGTSGQGNNGGDGEAYSGGGSLSGGGGGAGEAGNTDGQGHGGDGVSTYSSWGAATSLGQNIGGTYWFAGGGGYTGGDGGGGGTSTNGTANTGGGGGNADAGGGDVSGGNGGKGVVIIRFPGTYTANATTGSPTRNVSGGYTYYAFTDSGSITI